jgi:5-methylcytosine-specific restriction endonuclease McrA
VTRARATSRSDVVLSIVATDSTFKPVVKEFPEFNMYPAAWVGRCLHCNSRVFVTDDGQTSATIEHINPLCNEGGLTDPRNLALACASCNNRKGVEHDMHAGKGGRADEVIAALQQKRDGRWREPPVQDQPPKVIVF